MILDIIVGMIIGTGIVLLTGYILLVIDTIRERL